MHNCMLYVILLCIFSFYLSFVTNKIQEWAKKEEQISKDQGILKLFFRPFLRWFDKNLESLFIDAGRQVRYNCGQSVCSFSGVTCIILIYMLWFKIFLGLKFFKPV